MHFSEFDAEFFEASTGGTRARSSPAATTRRSPPVTRTSTSSRPASTGGARSASSTSRAPSTARPSTTTRPSGTSPTTARPAGRPAAPRAGTRPQPGASPAAPSARPAAQRGQQATTPRTSTGSFSLASLASAAQRIGSYAQQAWDFAQSGVQGVQAAQQFAASLGLGVGRPGAAPQRAAVAPAPAAGDTGQPAAVDAGGATGVPFPVGGEPGPAATPAPPPGTGVGAVTQPQPDAGGAQPVAAPGDQVAALLQALRQHQVPPLPGPAQPAPAVTPAAPTGFAAATPPAAPASPFAAAALAPMGFPAPDWTRRPGSTVGPPSTPAPAPAPVATPAPPADAFTLLRIILANPQLQQALQPAVAAPAAAAPRTVQLPVPVSAAPRQARSVPIPLGAVLNAIAALAGQSMTELNESVGEDEPEVPAYLVDDDGSFVVDPSSADDRAALVAHLFRLSAEAYGTGGVPLTGRAREPDGETDKSDEWAREAGFP